MPAWIIDFLPIIGGLIVVTLVLKFLPKVDVGHNDAYMRRRIQNWLPLGLTYALLYMGRYNLKVSKFAFESMQDASGGPLMGNDAFGIIFGVGTVVYGFSFLINGPLTDRKGGRFSILLGSAGALIANLLMGLCSLSLLHEGPLYGFFSANFVVVFSILYAVNMYFQSFGAVAIVKVNAPWFHVRERGVFGAIFGILISLGIFLAFDVGYKILNNFGLEWVFLVPTILLAVFWLIDFRVVRNTPAEAGLTDFNTGDATSGDDGPRLGAVKVFKMMLTNPIIMTIAAIEFCSGFLRQAIGASQAPNNQIIIGLALFLTFVVMSPTLHQMNEDAIQPFMNEEMSQGEAFAKVQVPLKAFMLSQVREKDVALFLDLTSSEIPDTPEDLPMLVVIPSFVLSELKTAFQMGFVLFIPFLIIDMVVASVLMSMGMMMLPPVLISLPFKILLFVLVDGWFLVVKSLVQAFQ